MENINPDENKDISFRDYLTKNGIIDATPVQASTLTPVESTTPEPTTSTEHVTPVETTVTVPSSEQQEIDALDQINNTLNNENITIKRKGPDYIAEYHGNIFIRTSPSIEVVEARIQKHIKSGRLAEDINIVYADNVK